MLTILDIVGTSTDEHFLRSQIGIGSESHCLFGQDSWTGSCRFRVLRQE